MSESFDISQDVCFVGLGSHALCYYRCMLPAEAMGCDWVGVSGEPPKLRYVTGMAREDRGGRKGSIMPTLGRYKVVVLQQVQGEGWLEVIRMLQERGVICVYEIDDYVHGIRHLEGEHDHWDQFDNAYVSKMEACMKACDALVTTTEWIAGNYSHFNKRTFVCRNGLDAGRYRLTRPTRETVNIGWAGGTGHNKVVVPWFQRTAEVMRERPSTAFVSIGQDFARAFEQHFGPERALAVPFAAIEQYPGAMTMFDIALAPGGVSGFWKGKSDLRWLEASALGIPVIANPQIYSEIDHGVTGFKAASPEEMREYLFRLVDDADLRAQMGSAAKRWVLENRTIKHASVAWEDAFNELVGEAQ